MALDAGEVYVVVGAKLDSAAIAKANAAQRSLLTSANDYQKAIDRGEEASNRLHAANQRWARAAVVGAKASAIGIGTVVAALGGAAVAAASFDASMRNVNSIAGLSQKGFKDLEAQVLRLSTAVGKSPKDLAEGLYSIVSSGFKAADAMKILTAGARAARAGLTDTATATAAITSVLNAYNLGAGDARKVSDLLFQTVNVGVLNFEQLAGSLGKVLPSAKGLGVSLRDLLGAEAALTLQGNSADEATTQLGQVMAGLTKPSKGLAAEFKKLGIESGQASIAHLGFKGTLDLLGRAAHGNQALLASWFGNIRAFRGVNGLEGTQHGVELFTRSVKAMDEATKGAGTTAKVYAEQQKSTAAQFDHLKAAVDVAAVTIGSALLPQINAGITALTKWFAAAQKSGDLTRWAHEIANGVSEVVTFLHSLGPEASAAFHVVASTIQAAIPFVEDLYHLFQTLEPAIADVAHAASGLASALGPGPILAAIASYAVLRRGMLTTQSAMGTFARVMQAGESSIATSAGGVTATGSFTKVGREAVKSAGFAKIAAAGIASSFGPQLLLVGAAGIVASLVYIRSTMTTLKDEAQQATNAMIHLNDARLKVRSAKLDVKQAQLDVVKTAAPLGSAAVRVAAARTVVAGSQGHPGAVADPAALARLNAAEEAQTQLVINHQRAQERLTAAQKAARGSVKDLGQASKDLSNQYGGLSSHADGAVRSFQAAQQWSGKVRDAQKEAANAARIWANDLVKTSKTADGATAATQKTAAGIAGIVRELGHTPDKVESKVIVDGLKAGRTVAQIRASLLALGLLHPKPKVTADTKDANRDIDNTRGKVEALGRLKPDIPITAHAVGVNAALNSINSTILGFKAQPFRIPVTYIVPSAPTGGSSKTNRRIKGYDKFGNPIYAAEGHKTTQGQAELAVIGEGAGPEYVIPTEPRYRKGGISLWMQAGRDLGIPGFKSGVRKPGKTPPPIARGLGYDPSALDAQMSAEKSRLEQAKSYRDTLNTRLKTDHDHHKSLEKQIDTAKRGMSSKNKKTAAAAKKRHGDLIRERDRLDTKIQGEQAARDRQRDVVIPRDTTRYQAATHAAKVGNDHANKINLWNDRADGATSEMQVASDQWDAADKRKDQKGRNAAYQTWDKARKERVSALEQVHKLLGEVKAAVGKTAYGAQISKQLTDVIGSIVQANDATQAPGYEDPTAAAASTDINDYLYQAERDALAQSALETASAAATADTADDVTAARGEFAAAHWILDRLAADGAPIGILTQAFDAVASARQSLESAVSANTPSTGGGATGITADQQAALDQQKAIATAAEQRSASSEAALRVFQESGDLLRAGATVYQTFQLLAPGTPEQQRSLGTTMTKALGAQGAVPATRGYYDG